MTARHSPAGPAPSDGIENSEPGLAAERTGLAWTRTAISFAALGGALIRTAPPAGILVLGMSVLVWGLGFLARRYERFAGRHRSRLLLLITLTVTLVSSVAFALALLGGTSPFPLR